MITLFQLFRNYIPYFPELRSLTGSINASIIFQQLEFRFASWPDGFYKFLSPCENEKYRPGDSWTEELSMSPSEFNTSFDKIAIRWESRTAFAEAKEAGTEFGPNGSFFYASVHNRLDGSTMYYRNHAVVDQALLQVVGASKVQATAKKVGKPTGRPKKVIEKSEPFKQFISTYPRPENEDQAWAEWLKIKGDDNAPQIMSNLSQRIDGPWSTTELKYIPMPAKFLREGRWKDPVIVASRPGAQRSQPIQNDDIDNFFSRMGA